MLFLFVCFLKWLTFCLLWIENTWGGIFKVFNLICMKENISKVYVLLMCWCYGRFNTYQKNRARFLKLLWYLIFESDFAIVFWCCLLFFRFIVCIVCCYWVLFCVVFVLFCLWLFRNSSMWMWSRKNAWRYAKSLCK